MRLRQLAGSIGQDALESVDLGGSEVQGRGVFSSRIDSPMLQDPAADKNGYNKA